VKCPKGQNWAQNLNRCEHVSIAKCSVLKPSIKPAQMFEGEFVEEFEDEDDFVPYEDDTTSYDESNIMLDVDYKIKDQRCDEELSKDRFHPIQFRHATNCEMFYKCTDGYGYKIRCPSNLFYNEKTEECDYPDNVVCKLEAKPIQASSTELKIPLCGSSEHTRSSVEDSFTSYFECDEGIPYLRQCDDHELFNPISRSCERVTISDTALMEQLRLIRNQYGEHFRSSLQYYPQYEKNFGYEFSHHHNLNINNYPNTMVQKMSSSHIVDSHSLESSSRKSIITDNVGFKHFDEFQFNSGTPSDDCPETEDALNPVHLSHTNDR
jgi:hypothetical protein